MTLRLDEKTTIPIYAALTALPFLIGAILWLASVDAKATKAAESSEIIHDIHIKIIKIEKDVEYLKERK